MPLSKWACSLAACLAVSCAACHRGPPGPHYVVTYYDRNHDGIVDFEFHKSDGWSHSDWGLVSTHFDIHYDMLFVMAPGVKPVKVEVPVPFGVPITRKLPDNVYLPEKVE